jgi:hypothetical protein
MVGGVIPRIERQARKPLEPSPENFQSSRQRTRALASELSGYLTKPQRCMQGLHRVMFRTGRNP